MHGATGSPRQSGRLFAPGLSRRCFPQYTGLGAARVGSLNSVVQQIGVSQQAVSALGLCEGSAAESVCGVEQDLLERPRQVGVPH